MFLYYSFVVLVLCLVGPFLLLSAKRRCGLGQKLGIVPHHIRVRPGTRQQPVWFHAVSVGEFNAAWPLIQRFLKEYPDCPVCVSTTTRTGQDLARQRLAGAGEVFYFPLDLPWAVAAWLDAVRPSLVAIVETEIWPGFTSECTGRKIPIIVVNGRISSRSFGSYYRLRAFFGPVIRQFSTVAAQSSTDAERYRAIAGQSLNLAVTGNLKFDGLKPIASGEADELRKRMNLAPDQLVLVAGSTHEGEEQAVLAAFRKLQEALGTDGAGRAHATPRLILAPRHPERFTRTAELITEAGFRPRRYSAGEGFEGDQDVFLLDTIGELFRYYSLASVAFVGGTLVPIGGHNILEPYAYAVPVICGPHLDKTQDVANALSERQAIRIVHQEPELAQQLIELARSEQLRRQLGNAGRQLLSESQGAVERTLALLRPYLERPYNEQRPSGTAQIATSDSPGAPASSRQDGGASRSNRDSRVRYIPNSVPSGRAPLPSRL
ncbi:MAG TPA: 3-deoxy-D-manno-octulosonic acid transferase [Candidatus Obscuribacterales bacterium]